MKALLARGNPARTRIAPAPVVRPRASGGGAPVADVALLLEGSYPYVAGGVSSWVQEMIASHPDLTFHGIALLSDRQRRETRYTPPPNLTGITEIYLREPDPGDYRVRGMPQLFERLEPELLSLLRNGGIRQVGAISQILAPYQDNIGSRVLMNSKPAWEMIVRMYDRMLPDSSFLDFFWTWRALLGGLLAVMTCELPLARVYHAVSTGYAGIFGARARLETGRPLLLTEHGIYTNERRIEITMADWLYEGIEVGLGAEQAQRDLRNLWIDAFRSYARACYGAADRIVTLYAGNQVMQQRDGADTEKQAVIPNGIDYARYAAVKRDPAPRPPTIALIGRVVPIKDVKTFIRACAVLREDVPDLEAYVLGPDDEDEVYARECRVLVEHLRLQNTVRFPGRVNLTEWLGRIDAIALTSISEAQPLVLLEAGAAGVPSVATDVGCCRELILGRPDEHPNLGPGGAITPLSSPNMTARALRELLLDSEWHERCVESMRARVERYYNKVDIDRTYRALYEELRQMRDRPLNVREAA